jgi:predicted NAD/FAD-dependent oxidoreductase
MTPPVPQSIDLLKAGELYQRLPDISRRKIERIEYERCLALLTHYSSVPKIQVLPTPGAIRVTNPDGAISWIASNRFNTAREGIQEESWVIHTRDAWSVERYEKDEHVVSKELWDETRHVILGILRARGDRLEDMDFWQKPSKLQLKKWKYAIPKEHEGFSSGFEAVAVDGSPLIFAGDAFMRGTLEGAYLSGLEAAAAI